MTKNNTSLLPGSISNSQPSFKARKNKNLLDTRSVTYISEPVTARQLGIGITIGTTGLMSFNLYC
jgi:hypothetical protein